MHGSTSTRARNCAADALIDLGETEGPLAYYMDGARSSDPERRRVAIVSLGDLGPATADAALPYLEHALRSSEERDRFSAVLALANIGEAGEPLLREALNDPAPRVRDYAAQVLDGR